MKLHQNALVVVADGTKLNLFENIDSEGGVALKALPAADLEDQSAGSGARHHDSSANPSHGQGAEDDFAASVAAYLEKVVASGAGRQIVLVAAPKTLGELRKHLSTRGAAAIVSEIAKDLTGHTLNEVEKALSAAA